MDCENEKHTQSKKKFAQKISSEKYRVLAFLAVAHRIKKYTGTTKTSDRTSGINKKKP